MQPERQGSNLISIESQHLKNKREQEELTWVEFQSRQVFHLHPFLECASPFWHLRMGMCPCFQGTSPVSLPASPASLSSAHHGHSLKAPPRRLAFFWGLLAALPLLSYFLRFANCTPPFLRDLAQMHITFPAKSSQLPQVDRSHAFCWGRLHLHLVYLFLVQDLLHVIVCVPASLPACELLEDRGQFDAMSQGWHLSCTF